MVDFLELSHAEAKQLLELFLTRMPGRLKDLCQQIVAEGGASSLAELDVSPQSLDLVWEWARPRLSWRAGYVPPSLGMPGPRHPVGELEPAEALPEWFDPRAYDWWQFSATTLWVIDGVARYLGACVLQTVPGSAWAVGRSRRRGFIDQNHLVITGLPGGEYMAPMAVTSILVRQALDGLDDSLYSLYKAQTGEV